MGRALRMVRAALLSLMFAGGVVAVTASPAQAGELCDDQQGMVVYQSMYVYDNIPASTTTLYSEFYQNYIIHCRYTGTEYKTTAYPYTTPVSQSRGCSFGVEWHYDPNQQRWVLRNFAFISCSAWR